MRRLLLGVVVVGVILYLGVSWVFASLVIGYRDSIDESDAEWTAIYAPDWEVSVTETTEILNGDRVLVADVYDNPVDADCGVIIMHGLGGTRALVRQYGSLFWDIGCDVMSYDFAPRNNDVPLTYGYTEKDDLDVVIDWFSDYTGVSSNDIGIWSGSYGAATTLQLLPDRPDLGWVIADSSYASMRRLLNEQAGGLLGGLGRIFTPMAFFIIEEQAELAIDDVAPIKAVAESEVSLLLLHSEADELIPYAHSEAIYEGANPDVTQLVLMDWGSAHMESYYDDKQQYREIVYGWLAEVAPEFGDQSTLTE